MTANLHREFVTPIPKRREVPVRVQRDVALRDLREALRKLGEVPPEAPGSLELHHSPPLALRPLNEDGSDWDPPQHDPEHLVWLPEEEHRRRTTGRRGESDLSISGNGDQSRAAKVKRIERERIADAQRKLLAPEDRPKSKWPKRKLQSRGFQKRTSR